MNWTRFVTVVEPRETGTVFATNPPPVIFRPATARPPENVEVAVERLMTEPPEMVRPAEAVREGRINPPLQVEVAVDVLVIEPPETARPPVTPRADAVMPPA